MHADTIAAAQSSAFRHGVPGKVRIGLRLLEPETPGRPAWFDMDTKLAILITRNILEGILIANSERIEEGNSDGETPINKRAEARLRSALSELAEAYEDIAGTPWQNGPTRGPVEL